METETILISLLTSFIASVIFWLFFNVVPENHRYNKVRPVVEFNIYRIYFDLLSFLEIGLKTHHHTSFFEQNRIRAGLVSKEEYEFWLKNKCLNESYQIDEMSKKLIIVGNSMKNSSAKIIENICDTLNYIDFLSGKEILLLRKIKEKLTVYNYDDKGAETVQGITYRSIVPHLAYMSENFYEINKLYLDLQNIVWKFKKMDNSINKYLIGDNRLTKAMLYYEKKQYKKCLWILLFHKKCYTKYRLKFIIYFQIGKKEKAYKLLKKMLSENDKSTVVHNLLYDQYFDDEILKEILDKYSVAELLEIMEHKKLIDLSMERAKQEIKEIDLYYNQKLKNHDEMIKQQTKERREKLEKKLNAAIASNDIS